MPSPQRFVFAGDFHLPHHDPAAVRALIRRIREWKPRHLILMGDFLDCASVSRFSRHPDTPRLPEEIRLGKALLKQLRDALGTGKVHYLEGNHEKRLVKDLQEHSPGLVGLAGLTIREQLGLTEKEWCPLEHNSLLHLPGVAAYHGSVVKTRAGASAQEEMQRWGAVAPVLATGHTHRLAVVSRTDGVGTRWGIETGCLADPAKADYLRTPGDWQTGWVEVTTRWQQPPEIRPVYL